MGRVLYDLERIAHIIRTHPEVSLRVLAKQHGIAPYHVWRYTCASRMMRKRREVFNHLPKHKGRPYPLCTKLFQIAREEGYGYAKLSNHSGISVGTLNRTLHGSSIVDVWVLDTLANTLGYKVTLEKLDVQDDDVKRRAASTGRSVRMWLSPDESAAIKAARAAAAASGAEATLGHTLTITDPAQLERYLQRQAPAGLHLSDEQAERCEG